MKVLDPMAGVRLASGHPLFHFSLFIGSWFALYTGSYEPSASGQIQFAFKLLQWCHFACFMLNVLGYVINRTNVVVITDYDELISD